MCIFFFFFFFLKKRKNNGEVRVFFFGVGDGGLHTSQSIQTRGSFDGSVAMSRIDVLRIL